MSSVKRKRSADVNKMTIEQIDELRDKLAIKCNEIHDKTCEEANKLLESRGYKAVINFKWFESNRHSSDLPLTVKNKLEKLNTKALKDVNDILNIYGITSFLDIHLEKVDDN